MCVTVVYSRVCLPMCVRREGVLLRIVPLSLPWVVPSARLTPVLLSGCYSRFTVGQQLYSLCNSALCGGIVASFLPVSLLADVLSSTRFTVGRHSSPPPVSLLDLTPGTGPPDPSLSHLSDIPVTYESPIKNIPECQNPRVYRC